jgi:hypothetical protein
VPSSTSSSEHTADGARPVPEGRWRTALLAAAVAALLAAGGLEATWRSLGHLPTVDGEDLELWGALRRRASNESRDTLVLLGKSRAQLDLDGDTLKRRYPDHTVVQLALNGRGAFAVFEDLARDEAFVGTVLFSMTEPDLTLGDADAQRPAVARAEQVGPDARWNARLRALVANRLVVRSHLLLPERVIDQRAQGRWPAVNFIVTDADRFSRGDFSRADLDVVKGDVIQRVQGVLGRLGTMQNPSWPWMDHMQRVAPLKTMLEQRGGRVIFLHLPVTEQSEHFSRRVWPKERFWDPFARSVGGAAVHYRDHPSLRGFRSPDTSHLDAKDAPRFTAALLRVLEKRGLLAAGVGSW